MTLTPQFRFGKITGVESVSYSLNRGIQPSVAVVRLPLDAANLLDRRPQPMQFSDGTRSIRLSNCVISDVSPEVDGEGFQTMTVAIQDRRWLWRYGQISGRYNVRSGGAIQEATLKTPRELAKLCLEAMGEKPKMYDLSRMPNEGNPHVDWDLTNPAAALQDLCTSVNSFVCLGYDDIVRVFPDGDGKDLPKLPNSSSGVGFDFGTPPSHVGIASGLFAWQFDFPLIPVGLDMDGSIRLLDELSYRPDDWYDDSGLRHWGWGNVVPATMNGLQDLKNTRLDERKIAKESVYRWYAIGMPKGIKKMPVANAKIESVQQFFPLLDKQLEFERVSEVDKVQLQDTAYDKENRQRKPLQVWGQFYDEAGTGADNVADLASFGAEPDTSRFPQLVYPKGFAIDQERRLVTFGDPVYRTIKVKNGERVLYSHHAPATLYLRAACNFFDAKTRAGFRLEKKIKVGGPIDVIEWMAREDLQPEWFRLNKVLNYNGPEIEKGLNYYLGHSLKKYESKIPAHATYPWLQPYSPDGRIAQVTFEIDSAGFMQTTICRITEGLDTPVSYAERLAATRRRESDKRMERLAQKQDPGKGKQ